MASFCIDLAAKPSATMSDVPPFDMNRGHIPIDCAMTVTERATGRWGYLRLSLRSAAQPLYTNFPIVFSSCFSKVTIEFIPTRQGRSRSTSAATARRRPSGFSLYGLGRIVALHYFSSTLYQFH
jgi:hypothetical protein